MSQPEPRFAAARLLVLVQLMMVGWYVAGVALPYLLTFTVHGVDHCTGGCRAPGDVFGGPAVALMIPGMIGTIVGPMFAVVLLLLSFTSLARRRREMPAGLRRWLYGAAGLTLAFLAFSLSPPGRQLLNWVLD
ncbi:hypothetical protein [Dactylosporangium matsuzakiense]|uniref:Uncharacterized protein n=1 Tax=Dactylosporangium matsuzakiense TaxID=53360 RepID=A0A9W6NTL5_9ACTN|nr:hypothetical protein [Dactylosporangium matsuzakiense]UWZ48478.1 hypothetical protein Dmats_19945 [Dactylosporangium matsuzakiense]GLL08531.1 hypothetical protein GCM10017581_102980 [Dactylosporangium matsuzakiense]